MQSSVMSYSNTGQGPPKIYQATSASRQAPGGVSRVNYYQSSHTSWKVLDFFLNFPGPGKSRKISLVLESPGNES